MALATQTWDASVKALVEVPTALNQMNQRLDWTQKFGDAFLAQQKDVMDLVQRLRQRAQSAGKLMSTEQQKVVMENQTIVIEQADPQTIYVPYYDPTYMYGGWPYALIRLTTGRHRPDTTGRRTCVWSRPRDRWRRLEQLLRLEWRRS